MAAVGSPFPSPSHYCPCCRVTYRAALLLSLLLPPPLSSSLSRRPVLSHAGRRGKQPVIAVHVAFKSAIEELRFGRSSGRADVVRGGEGCGAGVAAQEEEARGAVVGREEGEGSCREEEGQREPQAHLHPRQAVCRGVRGPGQIAAPIRSIASYYSCGMGRSNLDDLA
jgi:hypothetical protein